MMTDREVVGEPSTLEDEPGGAAFSMAATDVCSRLNVDPSTGLGEHDVVERLARWGKNALRAPRIVRPHEVFLSQLNSPVVLLLAAAMVLAAVMGEWVDATAVFLVLAINTLIGFFTEMRAVRSMEALRALATRTVRVRRAGVEAVVPAADLVPGDIVVLEAGDILPADMRIVASANLASDESALTGESVPVSKTLDAVSADAALAERKSMLFNGCAVTRGTGEAVVTATGMATELGRITKLVEESEPDRSPLDRQLERLGRDLIWITLAVAAAVGVAGILAGGDLVLMLETAIALAVAAIPEGLPIVATLALARGMIRLARRRALVRELPAVETLGVTTLIMTDKTGTLTENRMRVALLAVEGGDISLDDGPADGPGAAFEQAMKAAALCNNATLNADGGTGDPMELALLEASRASGLERPDLLAAYPEVREHAFEETTRMMGTVHRDGDAHLFAIKGAPEAVFEGVRDVETTNGTVPFAGEVAEAWQTRCDRLAEQGLRLLALAGKQSNDPDETPYESLTLFGVVALRDPPREEVRAAMADANRAGIRVVMVTGDHAATARGIAAEVGLAGDDATVVAGASLPPFDDMDEAQAREIRDATLFSRVTPKQKLDLVDLHQDAGEIVAMTGDGVNDAPALKKADIGIAMGKRGTEVAREAADMVLQDDSFATIVAAIREGRIIYTNIRRFTTYLLSCNLSEVLVVGIAVGFGAPLPLLPLQILFLNLVTDVFPALALATIGADDDALARSPRDPAEPILGKRQWRAIIIHGGVISTVSLTSFLVARFVLQLPGDGVTTMVFYTLALAQIVHVFNIRNWRERLWSSSLVRSRWIWGAVVLCVVLLAVATLQPHAAAALRLIPLPLEGWLTVAALGLVPLVVREAHAIWRRLTARI